MLDESTHSTIQRHIAIEKKEIYLLKKIAFPNFPKLKWDFDYNSSCFQRVGVVKRSCSDQNLISVCTLKQSSRCTSCGFTNIKSNWNMSRSDWKCSPVHKYCLISQNEHFHVNNKGVRYVFFPQGGRMGYPACRWSYKINTSMTNEYWMTISTNV